MFPDTKKNLLSSLKNILKLDLLPPSFTSLLLTYNFKLITSPLTTTFVSPLNNPSPLRYPPPLYFFLLFTSIILIYFPNDSKMSLLKHIRIIVLSSSNTNILYLFHFDSSFSLLLTLIPPSYQEGRLWTNFFRY